MKINRKLFLKSFAFALGSLYAPQLISQRSRRRKNKSVIIIGSGLSGLYAGFLFQNAGYKVKVLEAKNRIGGRVYTYRNENDSVVGELGAEWIHAHQKEVIKLCQSLDIQLVTQNTHTSMLINGKYIPSFEMDKNYQTKKILMKLADMYTKMGALQKKGLDKLSTSTYLRYQGITRKDIYHLELDYSLNFGESLRHISAEKFLLKLVNLFNEKNQTFKVEGGTETIIRTLVSYIGRYNIKTNEPVVSVEQSKNSVTVKTKNGKEYKASICICTIPAIEIDNIKWKPSLKKDRKVSNLQIKYGRATKILSEFTNIDWIDQDWYILTDTLLQLIHTSSYDKKSNRSILTMVSIGDKSDLYTHLDEWGMRRLLYSELRNLNYNPTTSKLENIKFMNWQYEPYIHGGYSIYSPGTYHVKEILEKPFGRVFFAGEHLAQDSGSLNASLESVLNVVKQV